MIASNHSASPMLIVTKSLHCQAVIQALARGVLALRLLHR
jgi:hypothetical protein